MNHQLHSNKQSNNINHDLLEQQCPDGNLYEQKQRQSSNLSNMLILQVSNDIRCFKAVNLTQAFQTMIKLYCQAQAQKQGDSSEKQIMFTLDDIVNYYESFSNIYFMQQDNNSKEHFTNLKIPAVMLSKEYIIGCFKLYCKQQAYQNSKKMAQQYFQMIEQSNDNPEILKEGFSTQKIIKLIRQG